jgi:hypothetical protein
MAMSSWSWAAFLALNSTESPSIMMQRAEESTPSHGFLRSAF